LSRFPVAFRLPAFACWPSFPAEGLGLPCGRLTGPDCAGPQRGCHVPHVRVATGVGALYTPGTVVLTRPVPLPRSPPAASQRQCPCTPARLPSPEASDNEASSKVYLRSPVRSSPACGARMERAPLGLHPELRTSPSPATHVREGTGIEHLPGTTQSTSSVDLLSASPLATSGLVSHGEPVIMPTLSARSPPKKPIQQGLLLHAAPGSA
jgi:hypothetical protein